MHLLWLRRPFPTPLPEHALPTAADRTDRLALSSGDQASPGSAQNLNNEFPLPVFGKTELSLLISRHF